jgi:coenzyme F420-reducing hydrogenase gamma subunit
MMLVHLGVYGFVEMVVIVSGTVSTRMAERMSEPKWVIAVGACAISGGPGAREFCTASCSRTREFFADLRDKREERELLCSKPREPLAK